MKKYLLGIDVGTSSCKVMIFDEEGAIAGQASGEFRVLRPKPGWVEQDPEEWWTIIRGVIKALIADCGIDAGDIAGIGVDGQSWSAIPIDADGEVLCNTPIWMDTRAVDICGEVIAGIGEDEIFSLCGNPFQPTYTTPKILWYKKHRPEIYKNTYKILQSNSFIVYRLTGELSQDVSQGYGLHFFDMRKRAINTDMCARLGVEPDLIPPFYACHDVVGTVTREASRLTGLAVGTPVVAGGLDAACGTLGAGVIHPGQTQEQGGQAGGMSICIDEYHADVRLILSPHVVPGKWLLQGGSVGGGGVLRWFEHEFCAYERGEAVKSGKSTFDVMNGEVEAVPPGSEGVVFLPYMSGERSPIWDDKAKGVYYGLDYTKTRRHMIRASMEGVAYSLRHNISVAREAGVEAEALYSVGGGANSGVWNQIKSDVTGKEITVTTTDAATSIGTAILAGVGVGMYGSFEQAVDVYVKAKKKYKPNPKNNDVYNAGYSVYIELYERLKELMAKQEVNA